MEEQPVSPVVIIDGQGKPVDLAVEQIQQPNPGAETIALALGYIKQEQVVGKPQRLKGGLGQLFLLPTVRGRKALVGQYTTPIWSAPYEQEGKSYPAREIGRLDMSEVINSQRGRYNIPVRQIYAPLKEKNETTEQA